MKIILIWLAFGLLLAFLFSPGSTVHFLGKTYQATVNAVDHYTTYIDSDMTADFNHGRQAAGN